MSFLFFGDSFTAGAELLDYQFYDDYPAPVSFDDLQSKHIKSWKEKNKPLRYIKSKEEFEFIWGKQKIFTYAHKLANLANVKYKNLSVGGSSIQKTRYLLTQEIYNTTDSNITVFIQPTSPERWMEYVNNEWMDFIVGDTYEKDIQEYFKFKILSNNDYSRFCVWLLELQAICDFCSNNEKIKNFYFINNGVFNYIENNKKNYNHLDSIYDKLFLKITKKFFHFPHTKNIKQPNFLPWGHVIEDNHKELALEIYHNIK